jgi:GNAT superfamily N-acetyltransferase
MLSSIYSIRSFLPEEADAYKAMRLEALQTDASMFGSSYARESAFTEEQWLERIINPNAGCMGLYCNDELIGITGVMIDSERPDVAQMTQSYIRKAYRGKGLYEMLYKTRIAWARERKVRCIEVGHRAGNTVVEAACRRFGFKHIRNEARTWPDGLADDILYYELVLR